MSLVNRLKDKVKKSESKDENLEENETLQERNKKIEDVLSLLAIPATFEIPNNIFLPEDLGDVFFDTQVPHGFDEGQVMKFVAQTKESIKFLTELLKKRNEDIAKLASVIDKLQVDANNLRWDQEIANGISVVPSGDDSDLERQLEEAKLEILRLKDEAKNQESTGLPLLNGQSNDTVPKELYEDLLDELSIQKKKNESLEEENLNIKNRLAVIEDENEDELDSNSIKESPLTDDEYRELGILEDIPNIELPLPNEELPKPVQSPSVTNSSFSLSSDDEDDSLDELMKRLKDS